MKEPLTSFKWRNLFRKRWCNMLKSIFWIAVITAILLILTLGLGICEAFLLNIWFGMVLSILLIAMISALVVLIIKFIDQIRNWIESIVQKLPKWLKKLLGLC